MRPQRAVLPAALLAALLAARAPGQTAAPTAAPRWRVFSPVEQAMDSAQLARAYEFAATLPELRSLLVARNGRLVGERYFNGAGPDTRFNVKSASKSILSALVGIAVRDGHLRLDEPALDFFPEFATGELDLGKHDITVRHLVGMTSGLESTSFGSAYGRWVQSPDWVRYVWERPLVAAPGTRFDYSTGNTHLLSAILTRATGTNTLDYLERSLLRPLGIERPRWARDPQGIYFGGNDMYLTARDLMRFAHLYLNGGRYGDEQVVPEEWVEASWRPGGRSRISGHAYGYGWWVDEFGGYTVDFAWGYGGQYVFLVPSEKLVVVMTHSQAGNQRRNAYLLFEEYILTALR